MEWRGLVRSLGRWKKVKALGRGREKWSSDERVLGSSEFVEEMLPEIEGGIGKRKIRRVPSTGSLDPMVETVGKALSLSRGEVLGGSGRRRVVEDRNIISSMAVREYGKSLKEMSEVLSISKQSVLRGLETGEGSLRKRRFTIEAFIAYRN
jgi:hypothetical protein